MVSLRPIDDSNGALVEALPLSPIHEQFVATVAESLVEAVEDPWDDEILLRLDVS